MPTLWFPGNMPVQFLAFFTLIFLGGIALQRPLVRRRLGLITFWQALLFWGACDVVLTGIVLFRSLHRVVSYVPRLGHHRDVWIKKPELPPFISLPVRNAA